MRYLLFILLLAALPAASEENGQKLYQANCQACHGPTGQGDGPSAILVDPPPANLTAPILKHGNTEVAIFTVISKGVEGTAMVGWSTKFNEKERHLLAQYVLTLRK